MLNLGIPFVTVRGLGPVNDEDEEEKSNQLFMCSLFYDGKIFSVCSPWSRAIVRESHVSDTNAVEHPEDGQVILYHVAAFEADQGGRLPLAVRTPDI